MAAMQLIYTSQPFGYDELALAGILAIARNNNTRDNITGALICREDLFLQLLEGPPDVVTAAFARIVRDDRHIDVAKLYTGEVDRRLFPNWAMRHDPARSWMWSPADVMAGAPAKASATEILGIFERLANEPVLPQPMRSGHV
jgi:Sensors of blue-light using FAD